MDADGTMEKGCKSKLWNPTAGYKTMSGRHTKCKTIIRAQLYLCILNKMGSMSPPPCITAALVQ
eukprot:515046-Ditylum_brightwellii.AAC.1